MNYLFIGSDRKSFEPDSNVSGRYIAFSKYADKIVAVVPTWRSLRLPVSRIITDVASVHGTNGLTKVDGFLRTIFLLTKLARTKQYDLIVARDPFEYGIVAFIASRLSGVPFVVQLHTDVASPWFKYGGLGNRFRRLVAPFVIKGSINLRVISKSLATSVERLGVSNGKITLVPPMYSNIWGGDINATTIERKKNRILIVSRLEFEKDIPIAFRAIKKVIEKMPDVDIEVQILGSGSEKKNLENYAHKLSIEKNIQFCGWIEAPWKLFQSSQVFLQSGLYEGFGMSIVEAYVHGCFCVSTNVGIASELVVSDRDGGVCNVKDVDCLASKIIGALHQEKLSEAECIMRKSKVEKIIPFHSFEEYAKAFMEYLSDVAKTA